MFTSKHRLILVMIALLVALCSTPAWGPLGRVHAHISIQPEPVEGDSMGPQIAGVTSTAIPDSTALEGDSMGPQSSAADSTRKPCGLRPQNQTNTIESVPHGGKESSVRFFAPKGLPAGAGGNSKESQNDFFGLRTCH